ncbi:MAG: hypothetical protein ACD_28C00054G0004 [uncultured bacterium]|nr:MAG: hypothetical protein ACD_28C00054G0004 [uncultured bacterium]
MNKTFPKDEILKPALSIKKQAPFTSYLVYHL